MARTSKDLVYPLTLIYDLNAGAKEIKSVYNTSSRDDAYGMKC